MIPHSLRRSRGVVAAGLAAVALAVVPAPAQAAPRPPTAAPAPVPAPVYDEREQAWLDDALSVLLVDTPGPDGPTGPVVQRPDVTVYAVGPADPANPQGAGGTFPLPPQAGGGTITIPQRDVVLPYRIRVASDCFGVYVVPGPAATPATVHTRVDPNGSGIPLAYEIDLGYGFVPLTANWKIQAGVQRGLLALDPSLGYGGTCVSG